MKKYLNILNHCPLFSEIENEPLLKMLHCLGAKIKTYDKKQIIISEGDKASQIAIMLSGSAQIINFDYFGNRNIFKSISSGEIFADEFACAETKNIPVNIVANEPSEIMFIDCSHILHTCHNACGFHHKLIYNLMKNLAENSIKFHQKIEITSKRTTREKLLSYLAIKAKETGKNSFYIPYDRQELADFLEVERSGLSSEIGKLRNEGIIESRKNHFKLL